MEALYALSPEALGQLAGEIARALEGTSPGGVREAEKGTYAPGRSAYPAAGSPQAAKAPEIPAAAQETPGAGAEVPVPGAETAPLPEAEPAPDSAPRPETTAPLRFSGVPARFGAGEADFQSPVRPPEEKRVFSGQAAMQPDMRALSDFFRRDSRRYDAPYERY